MLQAYFYSHQEIRELLSAAKTRPFIDPLRPWTYYCLFGLLAVTGLRLREAYVLLKRGQELDKLIARSEASLVTGQWSGFGN